MDVFILLLLHFVVRCLGSSITVIRRENDTVIGAGNCDKTQGHESKGNCVCDDGYGDTLMSGGGREQTYSCTWSHSVNCSLDLKTDNQTDTYLVKGDTTITIPSMKPPCYLIKEIFLWNIRNDVATTGVWERLPDEAHRFFKVITSPRSCELSVLNLNVTLWSGHVIKTMFDNVATDDQKCSVMKVQGNINYPFNVKDFIEKTTKTTTRPSPNTDLFYLICFIVFVFQRYKTEIVIISTVVPFAVAIICFVIHLCVNRRKKKRACHRPWNLTNTSNIIMENITNPVQETYDELRSLDYELIEKETKSSQQHANTDDLPTSVHSEEEDQDHDYEVIDEGNPSIAVRATYNQGEDDHYVFMESYEDANTYANAGYENDIKDGVYENDIKGDGYENDIEGDREENGATYYNISPGLHQTNVAKTDQVNIRNEEHYTALSVANNNTNDNGQGNTTNQQQYLTLSGAG